jgi:hypothetical protein
MARVSNTTAEQRIYQALKRLPNDPEIAAVVLPAYLYATGGYDDLARTVRSRLWPGRNDGPPPAAWVREELARPEVKQALASQTPNSRNLAKILPWAVESLRSAKRSETEEEWWPIAEELFRSMGAISQWAAGSGEDLAEHTIRSASRAAMAWIDLQGLERTDGLQGPVICSFADGYTIQMLSTPRHLQYEGEAMGHCIGGYWDDVANRRAIFLSLREPSGRSQVTMTLDVTKYPDEVSIAELQGRANTRPKAHDVARVAAFATLVFGWRPLLREENRAIRLRENPEVAAQYGVAPLLDLSGGALNIEAYTLPLRTLDAALCIDMQIQRPHGVFMFVRSAREALRRVYLFLTYQMGVRLDYVEPDDDDTRDLLDVGEWGRFVLVNKLVDAAAETFEAQDVPREFVEWYEGEFVSDIECRTLEELYRQAIPVPVHIAEEACRDDVESHTLDLNASRWYAYGALQLVDVIERDRLVQPKQMEKLGTSFLAAIHDGNVVADLRITDFMSLDDVIDTQDTIADEVESR